METSAKSVGGDSRRAFKERKLRWENCLTVALLFYLTWIVSMMARASAAIL